MLEVIKYTGQSLIWCAFSDLGAKIKDFWGAVNLGDKSVAGIF